MKIASNFPPKTKTEKSPRVSVGALFQDSRRVFYIQEELHCVCRTVSPASNGDESLLAGDRDWSRGCEKEARDNEMEKQRRRSYRLCHPYKTRRIIGRSDITRPGNLVETPIDPR